MKKATKGAKSVAKTSARARKKSPMTREKIDALAEAFESGRALSAHEHAAIARVLRSVAAARKRSGRPIALNTAYAAVLARELIERFEIKPRYWAIEVACDTVRQLFGITEEDLTTVAVQKRYNDMKKTSDFSVATVDGDKYIPLGFAPAVIANAVARLPLTVKHNEKLVKINSETN